MHILTTVASVGTTDPERRRIHLSDTFDLRVLYQPDTPVPPMKARMLRRHFHNALGIAVPLDSYERSSDAAGKPDYYAFFLRQGEPALKEGIYTLPISTLHMGPVSWSYLGRIPLHGPPTLFHLHVGRNGQVLFLHQCVSPLLAIRLHVGFVLRTYAPSISIEEVPHPRHSLAPLLLGVPGIPVAFTRIREGQVFRQ